MRALCFHEFGGPTRLRLEQVRDPMADQDHAVVAVRAASVNPSDVSNVAGVFPYTTLPRVPGRDYSGVVVAGPREWIGKDVWGTGNAGFTQDGSHAEFIRVPVASLQRKPSPLSHEQAASVGVNFLAAWVGVVEYAGLRAGETLVVIGAAGGVGGAAVQIGSRSGARVIGIDRGLAHAGSPAGRLAEWIVATDPQEAAKAVVEKTGGGGAQVVLNAVGGATFEASLTMLAHHGRLAVLASPGQRRPSFDLLDFYHNESQMFGVDTLKRDLTASAALLAELAPGFEDGSFDPPVIAHRKEFEDGEEAYRAVAAGASGRVVLVP